MVPLCPILSLTLAAGTAIVAGPLDVGQVDDTVRGSKPRWQKCARGKSGVVVLGWQISPEGHVSDAVVISATLPDAANCLQTAALEWRFPSSTAVTLVSYPFVFGKAKHEPSRKPLPRDVIDTLIAQHHGEVVDCGEEDSSGILGLKWSIAPAGHVTGLEIQQSELSRRVVACVADRVGRWRFPPSRSRVSVEVSYCFVFQPYGSKEKEAGTLDAAAVEQVVASSLANDAIEDVVTASQRDILACYEKELASAPSLAVELEVTWTIATNGRVSSASVTKRTARQPRLERCLLDTVSAWKFPTFSGEAVSVSYPFYFAPL